MSPTPPGGGGGVVGGDRAEGGRREQQVVQELWFIVVMAAIALLLLAIVLGVMLHRVRNLVLLLLSSFGTKDENPSYYSRNKTFLHVPPGLK